jgi:hypothetical protein
MPDASQSCACSPRLLLPQVRLNFLSTLLPEAYSHLHQHLCASVLGRRLLLLPFQRDAPLDVKVARAMRAAVEHCQRVRWPAGLRAALTPFANRLALMNACVPYRRVR